MLSVLGVGEEERWEEVEGFECLLRVIVELEKLCDYTFLRSGWDFQGENKEGQMFIRWRFKSSGLAVLLKFTYM